jgi:hypothetical protein
MLTNAWSGCTSLSSIVRTLGGGRHGSPLKQYFAMSDSKVCSPVSSTLLDMLKSLVIHCVNCLYKGFVFSSLPTVKITLSHHVRVEVPSKSGSIPVLTLEKNVVANLGCSCRFLKNLYTAFWART